MLTGQIKSYDDIPDKDIRKILPKFQPGNFETNIKLVKEIEKLAKQKGCTSAQLALGWVRSLSGQDGMPTIIPIPGGANPEHVRENAVEVTLSAKEVEDIDAILASFEVVGDRFHPVGMKSLNG